jgi:hypothetical protein
MFNTIYSSGCPYYYGAFPSATTRLTLTIDVLGRSHNISRALDFPRHSTYTLEDGEEDNVVVDIREPGMPQDKCWQ